MAKKCKHTEVIFRNQFIKLIPEGYEKMEEKDDVDLEDYETIDEQGVTVCNECGETPDGGIY